MRGTRAEIVAREQTLAKVGAESYDGYAALLDAHYHHLVSVPRRERKDHTPDDVLAAFGALPPRELCGPYPLSAAELSALTRRVQRKYVSRFKNIRRSWAILLRHLPELLAPGAPARDVFEMSTAHGATLEILRHHGHRVTGNDVIWTPGGRNGHDRIGRRDPARASGAAEPDPAAGGARCPYRPLTESVGLDVRYFDGGVLPYPFADKAFDAVICCDAIEHYCHPADWGEVVGEFVRLARRSVLLVMNPVMPGLGDASYAAAVTAFRTRARQWSEGGFVCVHAGLSRHQLSVFKFMCVA